MNRSAFLLMVFVFAAVGCTSPTSGDRAETDSLYADSVLANLSYATDEGIFTFTIDQSTSKEDRDKAITNGFLAAFAEFHRNDDSVHVSDVSLINRSFFSPQGCIPSILLELHLDIPKDATTVIHWYVITGLPRFYAVSEPLTEDITERQGTSDAALDLGYSLDGECPVVVIRTSSEGGDIDYASSEAMTFYSVNHGFNEILHLQLDDTLKEGYYNNPDSAKVTSKKRSFELVKSDNKTPYDIVAKLDDGSSIATERYSWDGAAYKLKE